MRVRFEPGKWYRFTAYYRSTGVRAENWQIGARLDWRNSTVASVNYIPVGAHSGDESVRQFLSVANRAVGATADVILLPEAITQFQTGQTYFEAAQRIPGPATTELGKLAQSDPDGEILAQAHDRGTAAIATIDLAKRYVHPHRGDMRQRYVKELRLDIPAGEPGFAEFDR